MKTDQEIARRYQELSYRMIECAIDPDHPATRANHARWKKEWRQVQAEAARRGMLEKT